MLDVLGWCLTSEVFVAGFVVAGVLVGWLSRYVR